VATEKEQFALRGDKSDSPTGGKFAATLDEVWAMWTTKDGIESWWGPEGFAVFVREIDVRPDGTLLYEMRAIDPRSTSPRSSGRRTRSRASRGAHAHVLVGDRRLVDQAENVLVIIDDG
jgi:hypothetical protein